MDLRENWPEIRSHFNKSFSTNFHTSIASLDELNRPTITPIGSLFLNYDNPSGYYFEKFPSKLPKYAGINKQICVLSVNSGSFFWLRSLFYGRFKRPPAIRLYGELGQRRKATAKELLKLRKRMRFTRGLRGHNYLWNDMQEVREITFTSMETVNLGKMTHS